MSEEVGHDVMKRHLSHDWNVHWNVIASSTLA